MPVEVTTQALALAASTDTKLPLSVGISVHFENVQNQGVLLLLSPVTAHRLLPWADSFLVAFGESATALHDVWLQ